MSKFAEGMVAAHPNFVSEPEGWNGEGYHERISVIEGGYTLGRVEHLQWRSGARGSQSGETGIAQV